MSLKNIDTFEQDIAHELKKKEVTVRDIATSSGNVGNNPPEPERKSPLIFIVLGIVMLGTLTGSSYFGYTFYVSALNPPAPVVQTTALVVRTTMSKLADISPQFPDAIGMFVTSVNKNQYGYTVTISTFSPVYAYMLRNEKDYVEDVAKALGVPHGTMSTPLMYNAATLTISTTTSSSTLEMSGTTTQTLPHKTKKGTTLVATTSTTTLGVVTATSPPPLIVPVDTSSIIAPFVFSDMTVANQNIRVAVSGEKSFYYAFIENKAIVFSTSIDGILALKNAILH